MGKHDDTQGSDEPADVDFESEEEFGSVGAAKAKLAKLKEELEKTKKERQDYLDGWQRCKADTVNAKRDALDSLERARTRATESFVERIIPVVDSFDMAMAGDAWKNVDGTWRKGVESIAGQLIAALQESGATCFGAAGEKFDPFKHEALEEVDTAGQSGTILSVVRRGWMVGERIVRAAQVRVGK